MLPRLTALVSRLYRPRTGQVLVVRGVRMGRIVAAATTWFAIASRQAVIDDAVREIRNDALMLADQEDRMPQAVDMVRTGLLEHMREIGVDSPESLGRLMATQAVHQNLADRVAGLPSIGALLLFDQHGELLNFSRGWAPPAINDSDREFIQDMTAAGAPRSPIGEASRSKVTGQWVMYFRHRFDATDGRLIRFIVSTIRISYFEQFYARLPLTGSGTYSLFRRDGVLLAHYPRVDRQIGNSFMSTRSLDRVFTAGQWRDPARRLFRRPGSAGRAVPHAMANFP